MSTASIGRLGSRRREGRGEGLVEQKKKTTNMKKHKMKFPKPQKNLPAFPILGPSLPSARASCHQPASSCGISVGYFHEIQHILNFSQHEHAFDVRDTAPGKSSKARRRITQDKPHSASSFRASELHAFITRLAALHCVVALDGRTPAIW